MRAFRTFDQNAARALLFAVMSDDAADFFRFLTNSYVSEPNPENAQRLWRAVFALDGLYFLLRPVGGENLPAIAVQDGEPHLLVWTDMDSLREYVHSGDHDVATDDAQFLFAPMPKVLEHILRYEEHGVTSIRFNAPIGWSVSIDRMRKVIEHFGILS